MLNHKIELLAPARNFDGGKAAIDSGADAVYVAATRFGAREAAGNSPEEVERLVRYAHKFYAKTYLTLNTILYENELEDARRLAVAAYEMGCDALIVQDMALLEMDLPPIPLFASTQCHNDTPEKVKFLEDVGFRRVILARELSLSQIAAIRQYTAVDLESFVHGALCVCYSGQCYLSEALALRSANRGACAQPCRARYDLLDANGKVIVRNKHLLSLRDLNLTDYLQQLLQAGITSFKIEGRLKNESYIKNVVAHYRQSLDRLLNVKTAEAAFFPDPERSFSRGFTSYFIEGRKEKTGSLDTAKAKGKYVGEITSRTAQWFTYKGKEALHAGDGICFFDTKGELQGTNVNKVEGAKVWVQHGEILQHGMKIYRNYDYRFEKQLEHTTNARLINASLKVRIAEKDIIITAKDEHGVEATLQWPQTGDLAANPEKALQNIRAQLEKTGNTAFSFTVQDITCNPVYFYPLGTINTWRRELITLLETEREKQRPREKALMVPNDTPYMETSLDYRANVANSLAEKFYRRHGVRQIAPAYEVQKPANATLMRTKHCIKFELDCCPKKGDKKALQEPLYLYNNGQQLRLEFDCKNCEMHILS